MMPNGKYRTAAGSLLTVSGTHGGRVELEFDWFEEAGACCDCVAHPYPDDGYLTWRCDYCGGGRARWIPVDDAAKNP